MGSHGDANAYDDTMLVNALKANEFFEKEPLLLDIARKNMSSLPVDDIDILIIDQMGKDISGCGIDPNIIGRIKIIGQEEPDKPTIKAIAVLDLTDGSHGNAIGMGLADVITKKSIGFPWYGIVGKKLERLDHNYRYNFQIRYNVVKSLDTLCVNSLSDLTVE